ncbi:MAG: arginine deiminase family protein [Gemmatimonadota bacterium]
MNGVRVTSEIGRLRAVVCHAPGPELATVTPANRADYLFDDILDLELARREHAVFTAVLSRYTEVLEVADLLRDTLAVPEALEGLLIAAGDAIRERADGADIDEVVSLFIRGEEHQGGSLAHLVNESGYSLPPLPNLFFTRDSAAVVGEHVVVASMRHEVRWTEELVARSLFRHHPLLQNRGIVYDGASERRLNVRVEGGDVHVLRHDLLLVGLSERTSAAGIDLLAQKLFAHNDVTDIVVVLLPAHRSAIHLDMIWTALDRELCCVYPPYFIGPTRLPVMHLQRAKAGVREADGLFSVLRELGHPMEPLFCGGEKRTMQEREQWGSGCNFVAVAPGHVIAYGRNEQTLEALSTGAGFRAVDAEQFLEMPDLPAPGDRVAITFDGSELVRGGGGPRCMTMPILRDDAE